MKPALLPLKLLTLILAGSLYGAETPPPAASPSGTPSLFPELKKEQEKLALETGISDLQLKKSLGDLVAQKQRAELEAAVAQQKLQAEIASFQAELQKLTAKTDLLNKQMDASEALRKSKLNTELADQRDQIERAKAANDLATLNIAAKQRDMQVKDMELSTRIKDLQVQRAEFEMQLAKLNAEIDLREKRDTWKDRVNRDIAYTREPFKDGVLTISDRRIALNGPITMDTADYIQERIDYFNNQSAEFPIFIVIDRSPGGSVMAGYKILKAMSGSPAPVYVVVKSFAASMAAGITTLSKRSFAYPNAIILHHQILNGSFGNLTQQKEELKDLEEWWKRLAAPVAAKMGVSLDEFIKRMYENRSTGDWQEFGDAARKLKWVDDIAETIREESLVKNPDKAEKPPVPDLMREQTDAEGKHHIILPRLDPVDCYYLYNPDGYYRIEK